MLLVYSVSNRESFQHVQCTKQAIDDWHHAYKPQVETPVFLVGNKADSRFEREVRLEEGQALAKELGFTAFREVSALSGHEDAFDLFTDLIVHMRQAKGCSTPDKLPRSRSLGPHLRHQFRNALSHEEESGWSLPSLPASVRAKSLGNIFSVGDTRSVQDLHTNHDISSVSHESRTLGSLLKSGLNALRSKASPSQSPKASTRPSPRGSPRPSPKGSPKPSPYTSPRVSLVPESRSCNDLVSYHRSYQEADTRQTDNEAQHRLSPLPFDHHSQDVQGQQCQRGTRYSLDV